MYDKKDLDIFGLDESFTRQELEYQYSLMLKKAKADPSYDISRASEAYNKILGIKEPEEISPKEQKKRDRKMKLAENLIFFIAGGIVVLILAIAIPSAIMKKSIDLHICISGQFTVDDSEIIKQNIRPEVKPRKTSVEFIYASFGTGDDSASYSIQALSLSLLAGDYDLMITDLPVYGFLTANPQDILILELSDYLDELGLNESDERLVKSYGGIYGIKVLSSQALDGIYTNQGYYYLSMPNRADDIENALEAIKRIINN
ncbi:MAG: hypothetical protein PHY13_01015 [Clostridia bacterium]|jgi:hypothetical protein|nr:hypothetical protein [Clostridia bacterium]MDD4542338.1 hypothetical protein [Clostridia bacterium]